MHNQNHQGAADVYIMQLDATGARQWTQQLGTPLDDFGDLGGQANQGGSDLALVKYAPSGTREWTKMMGTAEDERVFGIAVDPLGNVYLAGESSADFGGQANQGAKDALVAKFEADGEFLWSVLVGTSANDEANGITVDKNGCVYVVGYSLGDLAGKPNAGGFGLFVMSLDPDGNIR